MSSLEEHMEEQARITAACEAGECDHPDCAEGKTDKTDRTFTFDVKLFASISVQAGSKQEAIAMIRESLDCADCNFGAWPNGDPILGEASLDDDDPDLMEIDGEAV